MWCAPRSALDKAPGLDGFMGQFYVACWHVIKEDVMDAFRMVWEGDYGGLLIAN